MFISEKMILIMYKMNGTKRLKNLVSKFSSAAFSKKYLFFTNVSISFLLSGLGDVLEQQYEQYTRKTSRWNKERTIKMAITGITVGVVCHNYYAILDNKLPGTSLNVLIKKVMVDQLICSPLCIATFFFTLTLLENSSYQEFKENVKVKALRLYKAEWVIWPPAQIINFYFLPPKYRVLYDSTISLGYDVYTSYVNHNCSTDHEN